MVKKTKNIVVAGAKGQFGQLLVSALRDRAARNGETVLVRALMGKGREIPALPQTLIWEAVDYASSADLARI